MATTTIYDFSNAGDYTTSGTSVTNGELILGTESAAKSWSQTFAADTGFTYNSAKSEFSAGLLQQKSQIPAGALCGSNFTTKDLNWGLDTLTGTLVNGATVSGNKLNVNATDAHVIYSGANNLPANAGAIKFKYTPSTTSPAGYLFASNGTAPFYLTFSGSTLRLTVKNDAGGAAIDQNSSALSWTIGQEYEILVNWNVSGSVGNIYVDGTRVGNETSFSGVRTTTGTEVVFGAYSSGISGTSGEITDLVIYNAVQQSGTSYTPGYTVVDQYAATTATLPTFDYTYLPNLVSLTGMTATESNAPRYTIQLDAGSFQYWTGSTWAASNGTWAQSNDLSTMNTNLPSLVATSATSVTIKVHFNDSVVQMSVDQLDLSYSASVYKATGYTTTNSSFTAQEITTLAEVSTKPGSSAIKYAVVVNSSPKYWTGSAWATSNLSDAQFSTLADINTNLPTLLTVNSTIKLIPHLTRDTEASTPALDTLTATYSFGGLDVGDPDLCQVYGYVSDVSGAHIEGVTVSVSFSESSSEYRESANHTLGYSATTTTDVNGYWNIPLIYTSQIEGSGVYKITFVKTGVLAITKNNGAAITFSVPDAASVDFATLVTDV